MSHPRNLFNYTSHLAVGCVTRWILVVERLEQLGEVARARADIQDWSSDTQDIVELAWMHEAYEWLAHDYDVQIGSR